VISQGVLAPVLPQLSRLAKDRQWTAFRAVCGRQAMWVVGLSLLVVVGIEVVAIATLAWLPDGHSTVVGNVTTDNLRQLAWLAALLSGVLPCSVLANAFGNAYYAQGDTSTPSRIGVAAFTIGLLLRTFGFLLGGIAGLAAAATASAVLTVIWIGVTLNTSTARLARDRERHFGSSRLNTLREANPS
jgi:putative peptidoglycan lipid II flippase